MKGEVAASIRLATLGAGAIEKKQNNNVDIQVGRGLGDCQWRRAKVAAAEGEARKIFKSGCTACPRVDEVLLWPHYAILSYPELP